MFKFAWNRDKAAGSTSRIGLALEADGFTFCHLVKDPGSPPRVKLCRSVTAFSPEERRTALAELVSEAKLAGTPCVVVLPAESYSLRLLDRPKVEDDEISSSLPWLLKDVIDFDPSDATVDYFDFPSDANRGRDPSLFVAAARNDVIDEVTDLLDESGLEIQAIDIAGLALRNLTLVMSKQVAGTLLLQLRPKGGVLAICHDSKLYFARSISTGTSQIDDAMGQEVALDDSEAPLSDYVRGLLDELLLEIQRSLDYYESEIGKAPASRLVIAPSSTEISHYIPYLREQLRPVKVSQLDLHELVESDELLSNKLQAKALLALGGALRGDHEQQIDLNQSRRGASSYATLPIQWVFKVCFLVFCGLMLTYGYGVYQNGQLEAEIKASVLQHDLIDRELTNLENQFVLTNPTGEIVGPFAELRAERDRTARTLRKLQLLGGGRREGFSKYFVGFSRQLIPQLWLTRIDVTDGGDSLSIRGSTLAARRVPQLLRRLRSEASFSGKTFALFQLTQGNGAGILDFSLESSPAAGATP